MSTVRKFSLTFVAGICAVSAASPLFASGGWFDESPPATLARDLDRLPAKTLGEIILETVEPGKFEVAEIVTDDAVTADEIKPIIDQIGKARPEELAAQIDALVKKARARYVLRGGVLNELYDIRDAITSKGISDDERRRYCAARPGYTPKPEENIEPTTYAAGEPMRPHLLYLRGAQMFSGGARDKARLWFEEILKKYPDHPRAETAAFLAARCLRSMSFNTESQFKEEERAQFAKDSIQMFRDYLKKYPKGRYVADVHGWLGGLLTVEHPAEALEHYIAQLEDPAHPECRKSAAHMVEEVLSKVMGNPDENAAMFKVVAQHPRIAQAAVYLVLNAPEIDPYDGKYDQAADLKKWKEEVLPKLAAAVSAEESHYKGAWAPRLRAMLAQAASNAGHQEEALKLTAAPDAELKKSDDLLFARIVAFQRSHQPKEVAKLGMMFLDTFEESQLRAGVSLRVALSLVDEHHSGEAYVMLSQVEANDREEGNDGLYPPSEEGLEIQQSWVYPDTDGANAFVALKKTILDFAPLKELEAVLGNKLWGDKADALDALKKALAKRKEALEDFAGAAKLTDDEKAKERLGKFQKLAQAVNKASAKTKAQAMMAMGDAFEEESNQPGALGGNEMSDLSRRDDARALGVADPDTELENGNLMRHATRWWLRAARTAPATELSAKARLKVLEGVEQTARMSDYDFTRAMETNLAQVSRDIYNILQKENPKSAEARAAVYWSFEPCPQPKPKTKENGSDTDDDYQPPWTVRGQEDPGREEDALSLMGGYHALHYDAFGKFPLANGQGLYEPKIKEVVDEATQKILDDPVKLAELPAERLAKILELKREGAQTSEQIHEVNYLLDALQLQGVPGLSLETKKAYLQFRATVDVIVGIDYTTNPKPKLPDVVKAARESPMLAAMQDFVDYAEIYGIQAFRGGGNDELQYPEYPEIEAACRQFLTKHPKSPKREACSLVLVRSLFRQLPDRFGHKGPGERHQHKMDDQRPVEELDEPFHPEALLKAIAAYEKEFPKPLYAAEMRNYRGIVAWRKFDYGPALELTIAQLDDKNHPDLRNEGAVRLANIFADLRDAKHRGAVLAALKTRPDAVAKLKLYLDIAPQHSGHPLRCMRKYLGDQLGFD